MGNANWRFGHVIHGNGSGAEAQRGILEFDSTDFTITTDGTKNLVSLSTPVSGATELLDLIDVTDSTPTNQHALMADGSTFSSRRIKLEDLQDYDPFIKFHFNLNTNSEQDNIIVDYDYRITADNIYGSGATVTITVDNVAYTPGVSAATISSPSVLKVSRDIATNITLTIEKL